MIPGYAYFGASAIILAFVYLTFKMRIEELRDERRRMYKELHEENDDF